MLQCEGTVESAATDMQSVVSGAHVTVGAIIISLAVFAHGSILTWGAAHKSGRAATWFMQMQI